MNKLFVLKNMGFKISWKLIAVGLFGCDEIEPIVTHFDVIDYLDCLLTTVNEQSNDAVELFCEKDDIIKFDVVLKKFASKDTAVRTHGVLGENGKTKQLPSGLSKEQK